MTMKSLARLRGILIKELLQLGRERLTFGMVVLQPVVMLLLFGYAINNDPKNMPTIIIGGGQSEYTRAFVAGMENSGYFEILEEYPDEKSAATALAQNKAQFVLTIPTDFTVRLLRGERPDMLLESDASDPTSGGAALAAISGLIQSAAAKTGLAPVPPPFCVAVHNMFNPEKITSYSLVPGLIGVILTITLVMMTALSMTRERERGTMENLLSMPVRPVEVIAGKIVPYIFIGMLQVALILTVAKLLFKVPFFGSPGAAAFCILLFETAVLAVGITISSVAKSQLQAMQMTIFFFLPNMLLSGFMFPFRGMPGWAQVVGSFLPLTYFNRLIRGVLLKGSTVAGMWPNIWPLLIFIGIMVFVAVKFYRKTLD